jgi:hypothetical protein
MKPPLELAEVKAQLAERRIEIEIQDGEVVEYSSYRYLGKWRDLLETVLWLAERAEACFHPTAFECRGGPTRVELEKRDELRDWLEVPDEQA